jgi:hypothetical protein
MTDSELNKDVQSELDWGRIEIQSQPKTQGAGA